MPLINRSSIPHAIMGAVMLVMPAFLYGQAASSKPTHGSHQTSDVDKSLADQLHELQAKVAKLEAALKQKHQGTAEHSQSAVQKSHGKGSGHQSSKDGMGMKSGNRMGMMGNKGMGMSMMGNKGMGMMSGKGMDMGMMSGMNKGQKGMQMMGKMQGMGAMQMPSALPGFPGASHIYHIGATSFFLDHPEHITLTPEQQKKLNSLKEKALLEQGTFDRKVAQAEQELWVLTSADTPDAAKIEEKVREISQLQGDQRIAFIRAVGEAAQVLTGEQRSTLVGVLPPSHSANETKTQP